jgi:hypothetical protein
MPSSLRSSSAFTWAESALTPLAERLVGALEDPPESPIAPPPTTRDLEAELLEGGSSTPRASPHVPGRTSTDAANELQLLRADFEQLLQQREQLRARLIAEQERRERAEAELVKLGAQWLGTETQQALRERAEAEKRRALDAEREALQREAEQRVAQARAETALLRTRLGKEAPSELALRLQLRAAVQAELVRERKEAREAVQAQLAEVVEERDRLSAALRRAQAAHTSELDTLRTSVRRTCDANRTLRWWWWWCCCCPDVAAMAAAC